MTKLIQQLWKDEEGATMVEYGLMVALIAVVCIGAVTLVGTGVQGTFNGIVASL
jgi:pilus assembly protein Flp/PilA